MSLNKNKMAIKVQVPACLFAAGFIGSSIYCFFVRNMNNEKTKHLEAVLNDEQVELYYRVVKERRNIFIFGKILGLVLGYLFITHQKLDGWCKYCVFIVIVKVVACLTYMLVPKSTYFLRHITNQEQAAAWADVYVEMKYNLFFGFVLGLIGYAILIRFIA